MLLQAGHSLLVIEHNLEVFGSADWIIDLGPEGGAEGGQIVGCGPPESIATMAESHTGAALRAQRQNVLAPPAFPAVRDALTAVMPMQRAPSISVRGAREHNLRELSVECHGAICAIRCRARNPPWPFDAPVSRRPALSRIAQRLQR